MITKKEHEEARNKTLKYFEDANIKLTDQEKEKIEIADFGLSNLKNVGLQLLTYVNTNRVCAKELVLFPNQTCPEHKHPNIDKTSGKEETFRCRMGILYLYIEGEKTNNIKASLPDNSNNQYTVFHEIILKEGEQYTLKPNTKHWFQAGNNGAIVSEFSTSSTDEKDIFTDKRIERITKIV